MEQFQKNSYKLIAIGLERWQDGRPHFHGSNFKRAYMCFSSAAETDQFVSEIDGATIGNQIIHITKFW